jgi:hypothetical protein
VTAEPYGLSSLSTNSIRHSPELGIVAQIVTGKVTDSGLDYGILEPVAIAR